MKKAYVFPGQGSQFVGMGKDLYDNYSLAKELFERANETLGFCITDVMFDGTDADLRQTKVTQPAVFLHSVISALVLAEGDAPDMVAGHSLGEFSALAVAKALSFEDGLLLVSARAKAMQKACEEHPSTMAAVLGLDDEVIEKILTQIDGIVVPANYNCPGQLVISGTEEAIAEACLQLKEAGAKRALKLPVGGAFHSPLMEMARVELESAIDKVTFNAPICPIYQNIDARPYTDPKKIKQNLVAQLTGAVRWTQTVQKMVFDGATSFKEFGPGQVLQGLIKKINSEVEIL